jgi:hypothetical protein
MPALGSKLPPSYRLPRNPVSALPPIASTPPISPLKKSTPSSEPRIISRLPRRTRAALLTTGAIFIIIYGTWLGALLKTKRQIAVRELDAKRAAELEAGRRLAEEEKERAAQIKVLEESRAKLVQTRGMLEEKIARLRARWREKEGERRRMEEERAKALGRGRKEGDVG